MPRPDGPQFQKLYHGSNAFFNEGDVISPGYHGEFGEGAYAADTPEFAGLHASAAARRGKTVKQDEFAQPQLFSQVYEVEPVSNIEDLTVVKGLVGAEIVDPKGLRVKKMHKYVNAY